MSHELDTSTGQAAFVQLGDRVDAWHRLGTNITQEELQKLSTKEKIALVMERGRLNYTVDPYDIFDEAQNHLQGWKAFKRSDNSALFGVFPETYTIFQTSEMFELLEPLMDAGVIEFSTAGAIYDGRDVWVLCTFNPNDEAVKDYFVGQNIIPYMLIHNNFDRSRLLSMMETMVKVVCKNTLSAATGAFGGRRRRAGRYPGAVLLKHTRNIKSMSVDAVNDLWGSITSRYEKIMQSYEALKGRFLSEEEFELNVLEILAPFPADMEDPRAEKAVERALARRAFVLQLYQGAGAGVEDGRPTAWNAYMATTEAVDHNRELFGTRDEAAALFMGGVLANKKQDVLNSLTALAV